MYLLIKLHSIYFYTSCFRTNCEFGTTRLHILYINSIVCNIRSENASWWLLHVTEWCTRRIRRSSIWFEKERRFGKTCDPCNRFDKNSTPSINGFFPPPFLSLCSLKKRQLHQPHCCQTLKVVLLPLPMMHKLMWSQQVHQHQHENQNHQVKNRFWRVSLSKPLRWHFWPNGVIDPNCPPLFWRHEKISTVLLSAVYWDTQSVLV